VLADAIGKEEGKMATLGNDFLEANEIKCEFKVNPNEEQVEEPKSMTKNTL